MTDRKVKISHGIPVEVTKDDLQIGYHILVEELEDYSAYHEMCCMYLSWQAYQGLLNKT